MKTQYNSFINLIIVLFIIGIFFSSCKKDSSNEDVLTAVNIELISGDNQTAAAETLLENEIEVLVKDKNGAAFKGATVKFAVTEGSISSTTSTTDDMGKARVSWTLGSTVGSQTLIITANKADGTTALTGSPITINATATIEIGDYYSGGIIFYIDQSGEHGLICAEKDQTTIAGNEWGCQGTVTGATGTAIGTGSQNSDDIVSNCFTYETAADLCLNLDLNDYDDWFLPSKDELNEMYINRVKINNTAGLIDGGASFSTEYYWSSSEITGGDAWYQNFDTGESLDALKGGALLVRAVRSF